MPVKVSALDHIVINVSDVARTAQWYRDILGMEIRIFEPGPGKAPRTTLVFGDQSQEHCLRLGGDNLRDDGEEVGIGCQDGLFR